MMMFCKNECRPQPPRQPHTHIRCHRPEFVMDAAVKLQQHDAIYGRPTATGTGVSQTLESGTARW